MIEVKKDKAGYPRSVMAEAADLLDMSSWHEVIENRSNHNGKLSRCFRIDVSDEVTIDIFETEAFGFSLSKMTTTPAFLTWQLDATLRLKRSGVVKHISLRDKEGRYFSDAFARELYAKLCESFKM